MRAIIHFALLVAIIAIMPIIFFGCDDDDDDDDSTQPVAGDDDYDVADDEIDDDDDDTAPEDRGGIITGPGESGYDSDLEHKAFRYAQAFHGLLARPLYAQGGRLDNKPVAECHVGWRFHLQTSAKGARPLWNPTVKSFALNLES